MGTLLYGNAGISIAFDDRALWHLQIVITAKLRRGESFIFSWTDSVSVGSGRSTIWLDPSSTIFYRYFGGRVPSVNRAWVNELMLSANSPGGLFFSAEPTSRIVPETMTATDRAHS
jgi:hypothetical protein